MNTYTNSIPQRANIIRLNVPLFIRLLELAREELKGDEDIHRISEAVTILSSDHILTMQDYEEIISVIPK